MVVPLVVIWDTEGKTACSGGGRVGRQGWVLSWTYCIHVAKLIVK